MAVYRLRYSVHDPTEDTDGLYMGEIPVLPGCRAWAETKEEIPDILQSVAQEFLASYRENGEELPDEVLRSVVTVEVQTLEEEARILVPA